MRPAMNGRLKELILQGSVNDMTLNDTVWCTLAPSPIHGIGVFALRDIPKGQKMYCGEGQLRLLPPSNLEGILPDIQVLIKQRWPYHDKAPFLSPNDDARLVSFMNHSATPNWQDDVALRDITKGEEITEDYGFAVGG